MVFIDYRRTDRVLKLSLRRGREGRTLISFLGEAGEEGEILKLVL